MNRAGRVLRQAAGAMAAVPAVLAGLSTRDLAGALAVVVIVVAALCWVINDNVRTRHLALLIRAWRDNRPRPARVLPAPGAGRRVGRAGAAPPEALDEARGTG